MRGGWSDKYYCDLTNTQRHYYILKYDWVGGTQGVDRQIIEYQGGDSAYVLRSQAKV